jgi:hypothetical protein
MWMPIMIVQVLSIENDAKGYVIEVTLVPAHLLDVLPSIFHVVFVQMVFLIIYMDKQLMFQSIYPPANVDNVEVIPHVARLTNVLLLPVPIHLMSIQLHLPLPKDWQIIVVVVHHVLP